MHITISVVRDACTPGSQSPLHSVNMHLAKTLISLHLPSRNHAGISAPTHALMVFSLYIILTHATSSSTLPRYPNNFSDYSFSIYPRLVSYHRVWPCVCVLGSALTPNLPHDVILSRLSHYLACRCEPLALYDTCSVALRSRRQPLISRCRVFVRSSFAER